MQILLVKTENIDIDDEAYKMNDNNDIQEAYNNVWSITYLDMTKQNLKLTKKITKLMVTKN